MKPTPCVMTQEHWEAILEWAGPYSSLGEVPSVRQTLHPPKFREINMTAVTKEKQIEDIARVCHETNRAYCETLGDDSQTSWETAPEWQKESARNGVRFHIDNPDAPASASHDNWFEQKRKDGWIYGPVKDPEKKTHPCMVSYGNLPLEQRIKDHLFKGVVHAMLTGETDLREAFLGALDAPSVMEGLTSRLLTEKELGGKKVFVLLDKIWTETDWRSIKKGNIFRAYEGPVPFIGTCFPNGKHYSAFLATDNSGMTDIPSSGKEMAVPVKGAEGFEVR